MQEIKWYGSKVFLVSGQVPDKVDADFAGHCK